MPFKVLDKIMETRNDFFSIDNLKLSKFAQVLPIPILLIGDKKGQSRIFPLPLILKEKTLIDHLAHIPKRLINNRRNPTKIRSHQIVLFAVLENVSDEQLAVAFVVDGGELFGQGVGVGEVFAFLEFLAELFVELLV